MTILPDNDARVINNLFGMLPYSGGIGLVNVVTTDDIILNLDRFRYKIQQVENYEMDTHREIMFYRDIVGNLGRLSEIIQKTPGAYWAEENKKYRVNRGDG